MTSALDDLGIEEWKRVIAGFIGDELSGTDHAFGLLRSLDEE